MCHDFPPQITSEQEMVADDQKEKLKEQLAKLSEAFTLVETEEEEGGKLYYTLTPTQYTQVLFWELLQLLSSVMLSLASL